MRPQLVLLAVAQFAVEPKRRMDPENHQHTADRRDDEFRGDPNIGIVRKVVGCGVRFESREARRRVGMTILAGLQQVARRHGRCRVARRQDVVRAVAVGTGRDIGIAQCGDLAVIGLQVTLRGLRVAIGAVFVDSKSRSVLVGKRPWHGLMWQRGYGRVAIDAAQPRVAMDAVGELVRRHEQRVHLSVGARPRVSWAAMAAETGRIVEVCSALGARRLRPNEDDH